MPHDGLKPTAWMAHRLHHAIRRNRPDFERRPAFGGPEVVEAVHERRAAMDRDLLAGRDMSSDPPQRHSEAVLDHLRTHLPESTVREVRGRGLLIGIELRDKVAPVLQALQARGVLALPAGRTVLRLLPPLVISDEDLWQAVYTVEEVLADAI